MNSSINLILDAIKNSRIPQLALAIFLVCIVITASIGITQNAFQWLGEAPPKWLVSVDVWKLSTWPELMFIY